MRAKIIYFFKETFRAHSKAEYREIFSRGLNEDNSGVSGAYPWLYVRAFFALFILFTVNTLVLRLTNNALFVPSVNFLGGITFTVPFIILLYELYPKRDVSLLMIIALLVVGGTVSSVIVQIGYALITVNNQWMLAVVAGFVEEIGKGLVAIAAILILRKKNPYVCFLIAATVGAGFSAIEDMGYIFYYSDRYIFYYHSNVQATVAMFVDRGLSSFCTHILWTGAIGWAIRARGRHSLPRLFVIALTSVLMHICWDLPLEGWRQILDISVCVIVAAAINIAIVHTARLSTLSSEMNLNAVNEAIIKEAKSMGVRTRYINASNLTFSLSCSLLAVLILLFCAMPIGMDYRTVNFDNKEDFISFVEGELDLEADWDREYDPSAHNFEVHYIEDEPEYVVQLVQSGGYDYFYGYYLYATADGGYAGEISEISVEIERDGSFVRVPCTEYKFGEQSVWAFDVNTGGLKEYIYNSDGSVTAVTDAEEFTGYFELTAICITGGAVVVGCAVTMIVLRIKIRRLKNVE